MGSETLVPEAFGALQGVKIVSTGTLIAQPFAAALAAEMGAEVIQVERPGCGDVGWRTLGIRLQTRDGSPPVSTNWVQERRNIFCVTLDLSAPRGRDIFLRLTERADIWMESSKPGTYGKWGLDDAAVWQVNPRLAIVHTSGYGQSGHPAYTRRASYDIVGQAFGGIMHQTGFPDPTPPTRAAPWLGDYITALFTLWSSLAALTYARSTGKGQAVDVAQYEALHHLLGGTMIEYFHEGIVRQRSGNKAQGFQPLNSFRAADGWIVLGALSEVYDRLCHVIGLDPREGKWQSARTNLESIEGIEFDAILGGWVNERSVADVVRIMNEAQVPCAPIMSSQDMAGDPHYAARQMHIEWEDEQVGRVKGIGIAPKFSLTPGRVFRGSVGIGHDNRRVYGDLLGLTNEELDRLEKEKVI